MAWLSPPASRPRLTQPAEWITAAHSRDSPAPDRRIAQVSDDPLDFRVVRAGGWPAASQASHVMAGLREVSRDVPADESGRSSDEHGPAMGFRLQQIARLVDHRGDVRGSVGSGCQR